MIYYFICLLLLCDIIPVRLDNKYDVIVIPMAKSPVLIKNLIQIPDTKLRNRNKFRSENYMRIDIENYEEPTDIPDPDNFDYMRDDRRERKIRHEREDITGRDYRKEREDRTGRDDRKEREYTNEREDISGRDDRKERDDRNEREDRSGRDDSKETSDRDDWFETDSNYGDDKIVGGREVEINLYPYHAGYGSNCGGAIIASKWVVTAGHCGKKPYIKVGSKYLNQGTKVNVKRSIIHPNWSAKNKEHPFDYDFQLLELAQPLKFTENIQPVKIAHIEDMVIGNVVSVTGWGNTVENGPYSSVLRAVRVPIISKENCQKVPFPYFRGGLTPRMFCAGFAEGKKDACQGDSGGPAVAYDRLIGMVSFGYGCATPGSYGVYSKVAKVRPWIEKVTGLKLD